MGFNEEFIALRKKYIEQRFGELNEVQRSAALEVRGPLLILAGAGSGKTTVVVNRIRNLLEYGDAYVSDEIPGTVGEKEVALLRDALQNDSPVPNEIAPLMRTGNIRPWNVLAITFTNKAAGELKTRICDSVGPEGSDVFASTFHSACVRFLRRDADRLGFPKSFTIYDGDDSERALKQIYKDNGIDDRLFPVKSVKNELGRYKDEMISPSDAAERASTPEKRRIAQIYGMYQARLKAAGAFDFDDLIYMTVQLLSSCPDVRDHWRQRFKYIMVDEYQDTSHAQYCLVELLTNEHGNICVVGDDDQSIYRFRGATIDNILNFEQDFPGAKTVRLEQNYRSTGNILKAANEVISHNSARKGKTLWTDRGDGELIEVHCSDSEGEEAAFIARELLKNEERGIPLNRQAVLYRMNAQSSSLENYFMRAGVPYRIVGGQRFYDRAEIKDVLAYMAVVENPADDLRLMRIINRPARKIGNTTVTEIARIANGIGVPMLDVIRDAEGYETLSRAKGALAGFTKLYDELCAARDANSLRDFVDIMLDLTGYRMMLKADKEGGETRLENVEEMLSNIASFEKENPDGDLALFLEEVALISNVDRYDEDADAAVLMTMHSAKGLEFDCVYIAGMEEGIFPGEQSAFDTTELEEERRLAYVGITRARRRLYLTRAESRMLFGQTRRNPESRFIREFSDDLKNETFDTTVRRNPTAGRFIHDTAGMREYRAANNFANNSFGVKYSAAASPTAPSVGKTAPKAAPKSAESYAVGDRVEHKKFGCGTVAVARQLGSDALLEIDFDNAEYGRKKVMAAYAPLKKL